MSCRPLGMVNNKTPPLIFDDTPLIAPDKNARAEKNESELDAAEVNSTVLVTLEAVTETLDRTVPMDLQITTQLEETFDVILPCSKSSDEIIR